MTIQLLTVLEMVVLYTQLQPVIVVCTILMNLLQVMPAAFVKLMEQL